MTVTSTCAYAPLGTWRFDSFGQRRRYEPEIEPRTSAVAENGPLDQNLEKIGTFWCAGATSDDSEGDPHGPGAPDGARPGAPAGEPDGAPNGAPNGAPAGAPEGEPADPHEADGPLEEPGLGPPEGPGLGPLEGPGLVPPEGAGPGASSSMRRVMSSSSSVSMLPDVSPRAEVGGLL